MPDLTHEAGHPGPVAGVDEAGRGPLAGPVVAAAVILPATGVPAGIDDSKRLSPATRARLAAALRRVALVGVGMVEAAEVDRLNIHWATMLAMERAVAALPVAPGHVLVDGNRLPRWRWPATALVGGDRLSLSVAAASIVAKHERDRLMLALDAADPRYGWAANKGYGTAAHLAALSAHGPHPQHRRSFAPVWAAENRPR